MATSTTQSPEYQSVPPIDLFDPSLDYASSPLGHIRSLPPNPSSLNSKPRPVFVRRQRGDEPCWAGLGDLLARGRTFRGAQILPRVSFPGGYENVVAIKYSCESHLEQCLETFFSSGLLQTLLFIWTQITSLLRRLNLVEDSLELDSRSNS